MTKEDKKLIRLLKTKLAKTDYIVIKYLEGLLSYQDYIPVKAQREYWRKQINDLEGKD